MTRGYALYFDHQPFNFERRAKQGVVAVVIALHLFALMWALRTQPYIAPAATSLVVIELNGLSNAVFADHAKRDVGPKKVVAKPASNRSKPAPPRTHDTAPTGGIDRATVAEGNQAPGSSDDLPRTAGAMSASVVGASDGAPAGRVAGGSGSLFGGFRPPQVEHRARLAYPKAALLAQRQGDVDVLVTIGADGKLLDASVEKSSGDADLDAASLQSVRLYEFKAAQKNGAAVEAQAIVSLEWRIGERERLEDAHLPAGTRTINLDAQLKAVEFLGNVPSHRMPCDQMKNPDCLATPSGE